CLLPALARRRPPPPPPHPPPRRTRPPPPPRRRRVRLSPRSLRRIRRLLLWLGLHPLRHRRRRRDHGRRIRRGHLRSPPLRPIKCPARRSRRPGHRHPRQLPRPPRPRRPATRP